MGSTVGVAPSPRRGPTDSLVGFRPRTALVTLALCAGLLIASSAGSAHAQGPTLTYVCSPAPTACTGWYRGPVTVKWGWSNEEAAYSAGDCVPNPDTWVTFSADTAGLKTWCEIVDPVSGFTTEKSVVLHIDKTAPRVAGVTARPPDYGGWFNHPVAVSFRGSDATSGVASCSSSTYAGPDATGAVVSGSCRDVAGNVGIGALALNYDATPPAPPSVHAMPGNHKIRLTWTTAAGTSYEVVRLSRKQAPAVIYRGAGDAITDRSLRNGRRYRYVVARIDQAGNRAAGQASTVPTGSRLLLPSAGQRIKLTRADTSLPVLVWKPLRKASYYNVQVFHAGRKVLSAWPERPPRRLERRWTFRGTDYKLTTGRYCWHVWPGYGKRSQRKYGKRLGTSCFRIVR
jgi:hypothetical protein